MAKIISLSDNQRYVFFCPGCKRVHFFSDRWSFNGDMENPTVTPSILTGKHDFNTDRCHSFITDGQIQFQSDCYHELAGQTVPLGDCSEEQIYDF